MMEAVSTSETSVKLYQTTRRNIPEDSHLHTRCLESLKSHHVAQRRRWLSSGMMEAVSTSETSVNLYQTTRRNIPEDSHLHTRYLENLKSHHVAQRSLADEDKSLQKLHFSFTEF
jgi:hypothetical protein